MPRCAIYARVSTDKQGDSVEHQVSLMKEFAMRKNQAGETWETPDDLVYIDEAVSGFKVHILDRPAMVRLVEDAKERKFNTVLFKGISRFARDTQEALQMLRRFDSLGIRVISYEENYDSATNDVLIFTIHAAVAQAESQKIGVRVSLGNKEKAKTGKWPNSTPPFGYKIDKDTKRLVIDEERSPIIKAIFDMYVNQGIGTFKIAEYLNAEGIPTGRDKPWSRTPIRRILGNRAYVGDVVYGKKRYKYVEDLENGGKKSQTVKIPQEEWAVCENAHPAIIDRATFEKAQKILESRNIGTTFRHAKYPLTGKLICGKCGEGMVGQKRTHNGKEYIYYICKTYHKYGRDACTQANVNANKIEQHVIAEVKRVLADYLQTDGGLYGMENVEKTLEEYQKQLRAIERKIEKVHRDTLALIERSHMLTEDQFQFANDALVKKLNKLKDEKQAIEEAMLEVTGDSLDKEIEEVIREFMDTEEYTMDQLRKCFAHLLMSVTIHDDQVDITLSV
jgi:site-specific DNA recombinase